MSNDVRPIAPFIPTTFMPGTIDARRFIHPGDEAENLARLGASPKPSENVGSSESSYNDDFGDEQRDLDEMLYARHAEIKDLNDLVAQRGTNIPALYNQVYKFIQNPSTVSVETFRRMVDTDETIGAGVDFLTTCLAARMGEYTHPNDSIASWVNKRLNEIQGGWTNAMKEMLSACWAGFSVAEKVWANTDKGFVVRKLVHLPPGTLLFETHRTGELTEDGILQYQRNYNPALFGGGVAYLFGFSSMAVGGAPNATRPDIYAKLGDYPFPLRSPNIFSYLSIRIPVRKCIHFAWNAQGTFGSPYGKSLLRRVFKHWVLKDAVLQFLAVALDRKGTPMQVWYIDPNATFLDTNKWNGMPVDPTAAIGVRAQSAVRDALKNVHNDSVVFMPGKKGQFVEHDIVQQQSNANDFIGALNYLDGRMLRGLLIPALVFSSGDGAGSFALGQEHSKTFDKILDGFLGGFKQVLVHDLVREMIMYNYEEKHWKDDGLGDFGSRELTSEERQKEMEIVEKAVTIGIVDITDLNDLNHARDLGGFKMRDKPIPVLEPGLGESDDDEGTEHGAKQHDTSDGVD